MMKTRQPLTDVRLRSLPFCLCLLLVACQSPLPLSSANDTAVNIEQQNKTCASAIAALENPAFEFDYERGRPRGWLINQHAGDKTYIVETKANGVLEVDNFGMQYWMIVYQRLAAEQLIGQELEFSAEIKLDLDPAGWIPSLEPGGGMSVVVRGTEPGGFNRKALLYRTSMPDEPRHGQVDWRRLTHRFTVPAGANLIEVGFIHQAHGRMWVRKPSLELVSSEKSFDCLEQP